LTCFLSASLSRLAWYQPNCSREGAEQKLQHANVGEFIVRASSRKDSLAFSYRAASGVKHSLIVMSGSGYKFPEYDPVFPTVELLLNSDLIQKMLYREHRKVSRAEPPSLVKINAMAAAQQNNGIIPTADVEKVE
jgi:hypothetical protein